MPATRFRTRKILWIAAMLLGVAMVPTLTELGRGGVGAWIRFGALSIAGVAIGVLIARPRTDERASAEQENAQRVARESEAMFAGILGIAADAIISVDQNQRIVHFNHGAEQIFGYQANEVIGRHLALLLPHRYRPVHDQHIETFARAPEGARRMGERREIFGARADGTEFPAEASISKLVAPDGILFTVVLRDITERKRAEEDERFMADTSRELARSLDVDEAIRAAVDLAVPRLADAAFADVVTDGDSLRRVIGTREKSAITPGLRAVGSAPISRDSPSPVIDVLRRRRPETIPAIDDEWIEANEDQAAAPAWRSLAPRSLLIVPLVAADQVFGAITLIAVDEARTFSPDRVGLAMKFAGAVSVTIENARLYGLAQRANRAREEVLSIVSHDLRNPISAIAMCARVLDENPPDDLASRRELLSTIRESAGWTNRLIQDLVDVASLEAGRLSLRLQPTDPAELLLQARHMFDIEATSHGIVIDQEVATDLPLVVADGERIRQVFSNLLRNAIKFTPNGGRITMSARPKDGRVVFAVADSGPGIRHENQGRVFDRHWQSADGARNRGSGLGLSIAKGIVEAHGGSIWLESTPGQGATFSFSVLAAKVQEEPSLPSATIRGSTTARRRG